MAETGEPKPAQAAISPTQPAGAASLPAKAPVKGSSAEKADQPSIDRMRRKVIWAAFGGYLGVNLLMVLRFFFPRALYEPNTVFSIGFPADFSLGIDERFLTTNRIWVVREPDRIFAIFAVCTHLGCTPEWKPSENKYKCPCHGSGYDAEGINFEGPAPRPMDRAHVFRDATGRLIVDTSRLYMDDPNAGINQFNSPGAFLSL
jgi:cytochrome b6-f complex iron-sulfur subunit